MENEDLFVVGVGASAGGLESLELMFDAMPKDCGFAFVIVQHLSPDFKSLMGELLARHTNMAIYRVENGMTVQPNSLYLIPPNQDMIVSGGRLLLTERAAAQTLSLPIDRFFRSLASDFGHQSVAIVLSGTGSDGSRGVPAIHEAGGLVIVQSPESAKFDGMPGSAIETQMVDVIVKPEEIADVLMDYSTHRNRDAFRNKASASASSLELIFQALHRRHHIDFSHYKPTTIGRRVKRRIEMDNTIDDMAKYAQRLDDDVEELDQLYRDLLIGVTKFFRDVGPFETLANDVLPKMMSELPPGSEFRVWIAACATGEEAYSIAILVDECMRELKLDLEVKIFATDIHKKSIRRANHGTYPVESLQEMTPERRQRYFTEVEEGYLISPKIRKMVVFAPQNLIKDPPFTRLSLVTCRNFLIYLLPSSQKKVISLFHFGLRSGGVMMLGSSESPGALTDDFETIHEKHRIFRKKDDSNSVPGLYGLSLRPQETRFAERPKQQFSPESREKLANMEELLGQFMPAAIVIDQNKRVLQLYGGAGKYLSLTDGNVSTNLLDLVDDDLKLAVVGAIQRVNKQGEPVCYDSLQLKTPDGPQSIKLTVAPIGAERKSGQFVISLEPLSDGLAVKDFDTTLRIKLDDVSKAQLGNLERELRHTKENLQASVEEMETSNEELQATNEELIASNEELQSTNEELHSVNEELFTVNSEYQRKILELTEMTNDFENLLTSTEVHTLFLDEDLCVRKFTPRIAEVFHLLPHDLGRDISAFVHSINCEDLNEKAKKVLESGEVWEEHVQDSKDQQFLMRVLPYRAHEETAGVVLTLIDISSLVEAQGAAVEERERFERAIKANRDGTWDWPDLSSEQMWWSPTCYTLLGFEADTFPSLHSEWLKRIHPDDRAKIVATTLPSQDRCYVEVHQVFEYRMKHRSGEYRWYCHRAIVDYDESGKAVRMTGSVADIQDRKKAELFANEGIRLRDNFLSMLSHELRNPMGAVLNAVESLEAEHEKGQESHPQETRVIGRQTRHMARLLDDLLDVARFGRGEIEFRKEVVDLSELADAAIEATGYELESKQQKLTCSIPSNPLRVLGDPARLTQAQINLIVNASKFSDPEQEIKYSIRLEGEEAVISVADFGLGIPDKILDSIFDLFVQSEETLDRSKGGMGVGLSLARTIVEAHQGLISVASDGPGQGSTFEIRLPTTTLPSESKKNKDVKVQGGCKVLLVEDNRDALNMLAKSFRRRGFEVATAEDGLDALVRFDEFVPEVAVIDIGLPKMNGYEVAKKIRSNQLWDGKLLVALTGYGQNSERDAILNAGFDHHLVKPLNFSVLNDLIYKHIESRGG